MTSSNQTPRLALGRVLVTIVLAAGCGAGEAGDLADAVAPDTTPDVTELDSGTGSGPPADRTPCQRGDRWDGPACVDGDVILTCDCREASEGGYLWLCLSVGGYSCNTDEACARIFPGEQPYCQSELDDSWDCACSPTSTPSQFDTLAVEFAPLQGDDCSLGDLELEPTECSGGFFFYDCQCGTRDGVFGWHCRYEPPIVCETDEDCADRYRDKMLNCRDSPWGDRRCTCADSW